MSDYLKKFPSVLVGNHYEPFKPSSNQLNLIKDSDVLLADPGLIAELQLTQDLPRLKWMQSTWAGIDSMAKKLDPSKPMPAYKLTRFAGNFGPMMSEYVMAQIIARERNFTGMQQCQQQKQWAMTTFNQYRVLSDLTLGILGVGDIGKHVAQTAKSFGMKVWGLLRKTPALGEQPYLDEYRLTDKIDELLSECDYVCSILPNTVQTTGILSGDVLQNCKAKQSVLINIGRGNIAKEEEIITAIDQKWISHAILDVFSQEPIPVDHAIWSHPGVTITPHVSAVSMMEPVSDVFAENLRRYTNGEDLLYTASFESGY